MRKFVAALVIGFALCARGAVTIETIAVDGDPAPDSPAGTVFAAAPGVFDGDAAAEPRSVFFHSAITKDGNDAGIAWWSDARSFVRTGDPAPGAHAGEKFASIGPLAARRVEGEWRAVFSATLVNADGKHSGSGIWSGSRDALRLVVRDHRPAPRLAGVQFASVALVERGVNASGAFLFTARLAGVGVTLRNASSLWRADASGNLTLIARQGSAAPGGLKYPGSWAAFINSSGDVIFASPVDYIASTTNAVWLHANGKTILVAKTGDAAPGLPAGVVLGEIEPFGIDAAGEIGFSTTLRGPGIDENNRDAIVVGKPGDLHVRARSGDAAPLPAGAGVFTGFARLSFPGPESSLVNLCDDGSVVVMAAATATTPDNAVIGMWRVRADGTDLLATTGEPAPGSLAKFSGFFGNVRINPAGRVAFGCGLSSSEDDSGIWAQDGNGVLVKIVETGDLVDLGDGNTARIAGSQASAWSEGDSLLFIAAVTDPDGSNFRVGIFLAHLPPTSGPGVIGFGSRAFAVDEFTPGVEVSVTRTFGSSGEVIVHYNASSGSATAGEDFTAVSGDLTFADGEVRKTFTVPITNDDQRESTETINLTLDLVSGGAMLDPTGATVQIIDNDAPGVLRWSEPWPDAVAESAGSVTLKVVREGGTGGEVRVSYAALAGTYDPATPDRDFTPVSGELVFAPGVTEQSVTIPILDDADVEDIENVVVELSNPTGGATIADEGARATVAIASDDAYHPFAATYSGTLRSDDGDFFDFSGTLELKMTASGAFTGTLKCDSSFHRGKKYALRGRFDAAGRYVIALGGDDGFTLRLQAVNDDEIRWSLDGTKASATRLSFDASHPAPVPARCNLVLGPDAARLLTVPGWATMTTRGDGLVRIVGALPDGSRFSAGQRLNSATRVGVFALLPHSGRLGGIIVIGTDGTLTGTLSWIAPEYPQQLRFDTYYLSDFVVDGVPYDPPADGSLALPALGPRDGAARTDFFFDPDDPRKLYLHFLPLPSSRVVANYDGYDAKFRFDRATGIFHANVRFPNETTTESFSGIALPARDVVEGFGLTTSGSVRWRLRAR